MPEVVVRAEEEFGGFLFEDFEGGGEGVVGGFGEEEGDVLGHEDVAVEVEAVGSAGVFEDLLDGVFGFGGGEVGEAVKAAEGDEVEVAGLLEALVFGHGGRLEAVEVSVDDSLMTVVLLCTRHPLLAWLIGGDGSATHDPASYLVRPSFQLPFFLLPLNRSLLHARADQVNTVVLRR